MQGKGPTEIFEAVLLRPRPCPQGDHLGTSPRDDTLEAGPTLNSSILVTVPLNGPTQPMGRDGRQKQEGEKGALNSERKLSLSAHARHGPVWRRVCKKNQKGRMSFSALVCSLRLRVRRVFTSKEWTTELAGLLGRRTARDTTLPDDAPTWYHCCRCFATARRRRVSRRRRHGRRGGACCIWLGWLFSGVRLCSQCFCCSRGWSVCERGMCTP